MHPQTVKDLKASKEAFVSEVARHRIDRFALELVKPTFELLAREGTLSAENFAESVWRMAQALESARPALKTPPPVV